MTIYCQHYASAGSPLARCCAGCKFPPGLEIYLLSSDFPGKSIGLKFIPTESELFRAIPESVSEPFRKIPNQSEASIRLIPNESKPIRTKLRLGYTRRLIYCACASPILKSNLLIRRGLFSAWEKNAKVIIMPSSSQK